MNHLHNSIAPEPSKETNAVISPKADNLAKVFSRLGWLGFWIQVAVGTVPALLIIYGSPLFHVGSLRSSLPAIR